MGRKGDSNYAPRTTNYAQGNNLWDNNLMSTREMLTLNGHVRMLGEDAPASKTLLLKDGNTCFYVCGLKSMEEGVVLALRDIAQQAGLSWETLGAALKKEGRLHLETY